VSLQICQPSVRQQEICKLVLLLDEESVVIAGGDGAPDASLNGSVTTNFAPPCSLSLTTILPSKANL
jgi:hypothetical protein